MSNKQTIHYSIQPSYPEAHLFTVTCTIPSPDPDGQIVSLPAWIPGSYMIRDFAKNVVQLHAETVSGQTRQVTRQDKSSWKIEATDEDLLLAYEVYAWDLSVRAAHLDTTHGYFNGTSVFLEICGKSDLPCTVEIMRPSGKHYRHWRVATSMPRARAKLHDFGRYQAANYDELVDHPVEMGDFTLASFEVAKTPHYVAITGQHRADMDRLCRDLKKICETHVNMFGELPPMEHYVFLVMAVGEGYGGLEHRASTSLLCSRNDLPLPGEENINDNYRTFLGLCSHEYFHTWNVKRIKPAVFLPYDLSQETHTRQLWAFEGITSYYDDLALLRSGLIDLQAYLELLGQTATRVWRSKGRFKQSVADSSFDAWTKFYKQDENAPNAIISYYTKGALIALALDITLRQLSNNRKSLDDLMRMLWKEYGKPAIGIEEGEIEKRAGQLINSDLTGFFQSCVYGTDDPPLEKLMAYIGIDFSQRAATGSDDNGGKALTKEQLTNLPSTSLGARFSDSNTGITLNYVFEQGATMQAGLSAGDVIIAVDGLKVNKSSLEKMISQRAIGDVIKIHAFRRDELMEFELCLQEAKKDTCVFSISETADKGQILNRTLWQKNK